MPYIQPFLQCILYWHAYRNSCRNLNGWQLVKILHLTPFPTQTDTQKASITLILPLCDSITSTDRQMEGPTDRQMKLWSLCSPQLKVSKCSFSHFSTWWPQTDGPTDWRTDKAANRIACLQLKKELNGPADIWYKGSRDQQTKRVVESCARD